MRLILIAVLLFAFGELLPVVALAQEVEVTAEPVATVIAPEVPIAPSAPVVDFTWVPDYYMVGLYLLLGVALLVLGVQAVLLYRSAPPWMRSGVDAAIIEFIQNQRAVVAKSATRLDDATLEWLVEQIESRLAIDIPESGSTSIGQSTGSVG